MGILIKYFRPLYLGWPFFLLLLSCASGQRSEREHFRDLFSKGKYQDSIDYFKKEIAGKDSKADLLQYLEFGRVQFMLGLYSEAALNFQKGLDLYQEYYTQSISQKVATAAANDNYQNYRGESYEISMAYYYLAMSNLMLYQQDQSSQKRQYLFSARAAIVGWDSYLQTLGNNRGYESFYQKDLWGKIIGGLIHQYIDSREDGQISLQLFKDAYALFRSQGLSYQIYNKNFDKFTSKIKDAKFQLYSDYLKDLNETSEAEALRIFLAKKIAYLTKKYRPSDLRNTLKDYQLKESEVDLDRKNQIELMVVLEEGLVSRKIPKKFDIGLKGAIENSEGDTKSKISASVLPFLAMFAADKLGLTNNGQSAGGFLFGYEVAKVAVMEASISFEMPMVEPSLPQYTYKIEFQNKDKKYESRLPLMNSLGEIARQEVESRTFSNWTKTGLRVAGKHLVAIAGAYATYKAISPKDDDGKAFLAKVAAVASYVAASKGIEASEKADVRYWTTLPNSLTADVFYLEPGEYQVTIYRAPISTNEWSEVKKITVNVQTDTILNLRD